jgi:hypothetical protein
MEVHRKGRKIFVTIDGVTKDYHEWAREFGIGETTVTYRISAGWEPESWFMKADGKGRHKATSEMKKRGCWYCADFNRVCPHKGCPYNELDGFKTYDEYLKKGKKNGLVKMLEDLG